MALKGKSNIVLVATSGRDSQSKKNHYIHAAQKLGLAVAKYPDQHTLGVFHCSDMLAVNAAALAQAHGIKAADPLAVSIATHKILAYQFLRKNGFDTLPWILPMVDDDLKLVRDHPVIVKPERGSGSFTPHPWSYRIFENIRAFRKYLIKENLKEAFLEYQNDPSAWHGRYIMMEYVDTRDTHIAAAVVGETSFAIYDNGTINFSTNLQGQWSLSGPADKWTGQLKKVIQTFFDNGLRRTIIYIQSIKRHGKLYPIDINLRMGTMSDCAIDGLKLPFYQAILAFKLGFTENLDFAWPAPYVGIRRVVVPLQAGRQRVTFSQECVPLLDELSYDPEKPFDLGHAWPMFAVLGKTAGECQRKSDCVVNAMRFVKP